MEFQHQSVLLSECIEGLNIRPDGFYLDGTAGGGGHSYAIAQRLTTGKLLALDRDPDAIQAAERRLKGLPAKVIHRNFSEIQAVLQEEEIPALDGVLLDLGVSSHQLDCAERGFSYHADAPLDMRMSQEGLSARELVNTAEASELSRILSEYGEERFARSIVAKIIAARSQKPIETTGELAELVCAGIPAKYRRDKNPCRKTFQAIRIAVNGELDHLSEGLDAAFQSLRIGGRLAVITFHSLEDRIVKQRFAKFCTGCICPPEFPQCICGRLPEGKLISKKPIIAGEKELSENHRSRSAKLRIIERERACNG